MNIKNLEKRVEGLERISLRKCLSVEERLATVIQRPGEDGGLFLVRCLAVVTLEELVAASYAVSIGVAEKVDGSALESLLKKRPGEEFTLEDLVAPNPPYVD